MVDPFWTEAFSCSICNSCAEGSAVSTPPLFFSASEQPCIEAATVLPIEAPSLSHPKWVQTKSPCIETGPRLNWSNWEIVMKYSWKETYQSFYPCCWCLVFNIYLRRSATYVKRKLLLWSVWTHPLVSSQTLDGFWWNLDLTLCCWGPIQYHTF